MSETSTVGSDNPSPSDSTGEPMKMRPIGTERAQRRPVVPESSAGMPLWSSNGPAGRNNKYYSKKHFI